MARIRCHYTDCALLDDGYCSAAHIELDPDTGCATYAATEDKLRGELDVDEVDIDEVEDEEEDEDDSGWDDEEEDEF